MHASCLNFLIRVPVFRRTQSSGRIAREKFFLAGKQQESRPRGYRQVPGSAADRKLSPHEHNNVKLEGGGAANWSSLPFPTVGSARLGSSWLSRASAQSEAAEATQATGLATGRAAARRPAAAPAKLIARLQRR